MPRVDSGSCFGRLLDWEKGGYCQIVPSRPYEVSRRYLDDTLILEATFRTEKGEARLLDCFTMRRGGKEAPHQQILRIIEGIDGKMEFTLQVVPCFDYGTAKAWIRKYEKDHYIAIGGNDGLLISSDFDCKMMDRHSIMGSCRINKGQRAHVSILYRLPEELDEGVVKPPSIKELDTRFEETVEWWRSWSSKSSMSGPYAVQGRRSAMVLKGLSNAPTGAIAAAPTTSLPEAIKGERNWDYRYSWIRDSCFTVRSLAEVGHVNEAEKFRKFIERTAAGSADELQILFGVGGERRTNEFVIDELNGYRKIKPVRIGNSASKQIQLDMYGELVDLAWSWHKLGHSPDDDYWEFLVGIINAAAKNWNEPDHGIWEMRSPPRHFVLSKAMCWSALNRGIKLAKDLHRKAPADKWKKARDDARRMIEKKGYDRKRGVFIQAFNRPEMDSALLLLPMTGFVEYDDERMIRTTDAIRKDLEEDGFLRRYRNSSDGIRTREGSFLPCSFWLVECLAKQGRTDEARQIFDRLLSTGNDLGLFSEEYDPKDGEMMGNFPQGLTHLSFITAAMSLAQIKDNRNSRDL
jgi:pentatricopeptide repeat protein